MSSTSWFRHLLHIRRAPTISSLLFVVFAIQWLKNLIFESFAAVIPVPLIARTNTKSVRFWRRTLVDGFDWFPPLYYRPLPRTFSVKRRVSKADKVANASWAMIWCAVGRKLLPKRATNRGGGYCYVTLRAYIAIGSPSRINSFFCSSSSWSSTPLAKVIFTAFQELSSPPPLFSSAWFPCSMPCSFAVPSPLFPLDRSYRVPVQRQHQSFDHSHLDRRFHRTSSLRRFVSCRRAFVFGGKIQHERRHSSFKDQQRDRTTFWPAGKAKLRRHRCYDHRGQNPSPARDASDASRALSFDPYFHRQKRSRDGVAALLSYQCRWCLQSRGVFIFVAFRPCRHLRLRKNHTSYSGTKIVPPGQITVNHASAS